MLYKTNLLLLAIFYTNLIISCCDPDENERIFRIEQAERERKAKIKPQAQTDKDKLITKEIENKKSEEIEPKKDKEKTLSRFEALILMHDKERKKVSESHHPLLSLTHDQKIKKLADILGATLLSFLINVLGYKNIDQLIEIGLCDENIANKLNHAFFSNNNLKIAINFQRNPWYCKKMIELTYFASKEKGPTLINGIKDVQAAINTAHNDCCQLLPNSIVILDQKNFWTRENQDKFLGIIIIKNILSEQPITLDFYDDDEAL